MEYNMYKIVCNDQEVLYTCAGSTKNFIKRKSRHKCDSKNRKKCTYENL